MPAHSNYVDVFGHFTTTHTSHLYFSRPSMVRWLLDCQPPPGWSPLSKTGMDTNFLKTFRSLGKPWLSDHQCPSCFISLGSSSFVQLHPILPSMLFRTTLARGKLTWLQKAPHQHQNPSNHHFIKRRQCLTKHLWKHHHQTNLLPKLVVKNLRQRRGNQCKFHHLFMCELNLRFWKILFVCLCIRRIGCICMHRLLVLVLVDLVRWCLSKLWRVFFSCLFSFFTD